METSKISDWLQVMGMFGVMASLVFVGLQMKQTQEIALSSIYQSRSDATVEQVMAAASSPDILGVLAKAYRGQADHLTMQTINPQGQTIDRLEITKHDGALNRE